MKLNSKMETVGEEEVAHIVSIWTGVPVNKLTEDEADALIADAKEIGTALTA